MAEYAEELTIELEENSCVIIKGTVIKDCFNVMPSKEIYVCIENPTINDIGKAIVDEYRKQEAEGKVI